MVGVRAVLVAHVAALMNADEPAAMEDLDAIGVRFAGVAGSATAFRTIYDGGKISNP
jgi:hypothetical protein